MPATAAPFSRAAAAQIARDLDGLAISYDRMRATGSGDDATMLATTAPLSLGAAARRRAEQQRQEEEEVGSHASLECGLWRADDGGAQYSHDARRNTAWYDDRRESLLDLYTSLYPDESGSAEDELAAEDEAAAVLDELESHYPADAFQNALKAARLGGGTVASHAPQLEPLYADAGADADNGDDHGAREPGWNTRGASGFYGGGGRGADSHDTGWRPDLIIRDDVGPTSRQQSFATTVSSTAKGSPVVDPRPSMHSRELSSGSGGAMRGHRRERSVASDEPAPSTSRMSVHVPRPSNTTASTYVTMRSSSEETDSSVATPHTPISAHQAGYSYSSSAGKHHVAHTDSLDSAQDAQVVTVTPRPGAPVRLHSFEKVRPKWGRTTSNTATRVRSRERSEPITVEKISAPIPLQSPLTNAPAVLERAESPRTSTKGSRRGRASSKASSTTTTHSKQPHRLETASPMLSQQGTPRPAEREATTSTGSVVEGLVNGSMAAHPPLTRGKSFGGRFGLGRSSTPKPVARSTSALSHGKRRNKKIEISVPIVPHGFVEALGMNTFELVPGQRVVAPVPIPRRSMGSTDSAAPRKAHITIDDDDEQEHVVTSQVPARSAVDRSGLVVDDVEYSNRPFTRTSPQPAQYSEPLPPELTSTPSDASAYSPPPLEVPDVRSPSTDSSLYPSADDTDASTGFRFPFQQPFGQQQQQRRVSKQSIQPHAPEVLVVQPSRKLSTQSLNQPFHQLFPPHVVAASKPAAPQSSTGEFRNPWGSQQNPSPHSSRKAGWSSNSSPSSRQDVSFNRKPSSRSELSPGQVEEVARFAQQMHDPEDDRFGRGAVTFSMMSTSTVESPTFMTFQQSAQKSKPKSVSPFGRFDVPSNADRSMSSRPLDSMVSPMSASTALPKMSPSAFERPRSPTPPRLNNRRPSHDYRRGSIDVYNANRRSTLSGNVIWGGGAPSQQNGSSVRNSGASYEDEQYRSPSQQSAVNPRVHQLRGHAPSASVSSTTSSIAQPALAPSAGMFRNPFGATAPAWR